ncbi:hypothetical protein ABCR88_16940 [Pseudomonas sp. W17]|uniref:Uncharacterized protein n=1 Tax=Pseudomonas sp. W17 TaxID=3144407 RepID=A0AAU7WMT3_9PSED
MPKPKKNNPRSTPPASTAPSPHRYLFPFGALLLLLVLGGLAWFLLAEPPRLAAAQALQEQLQRSDLPPIRRTGQLSQRPGTDTAMEATQPRGPGVAIGRMARRARLPKPHQNQSNRINYQF